MAEATPLIQGLDPKSATKKTSAAPEATSSTASTYRLGRVVVAGHFAPEVQKALRFLAVEYDTTIQALLAEALNMLFASYGKPEIAGPAPASAAPVATIYTTAATASYTDQINAKLDEILHRLERPFP